MKLLILLSTCIYIHLTLCEENLNKLFEEINKNVLKFNTIAADIAWESSVNPGNPEIKISSANYQEKWLDWQHSTCERLAGLHNRHLLNNVQRRQTYFLCRGPRYTLREARQVTSLYERLQSLYSNVEICIPTEHNITATNNQAESAILNYLTAVKLLLNLSDGVSLAAKVAVSTDSEKEGFCLNGEDDFERLMNNLENEEALRWLWIVWREKVGKKMKEPYSRLVNLENQAAWRNGYTDIGAYWRDELEVPNLRKLCRKLYSDIKPLYTLLHGVVRFYLRRLYGDVVPKGGPIPAHLLGNLWSQNWEAMVDLIIPEKLDLDASIKNLNWTVNHMVKRVEDFYQSLGLPAMPDTFWSKSVFKKKNNNTRCHGTAADMFRRNDYRLLYCSGTEFEDFYVLHHEFGHIHYYMAYENQPALFRQANAALHESIGDAIMYGVTTPQHLHRLGLVNDSILYVYSSRTFHKLDKLETKRYQTANTQRDERAKTTDDLDKVSSNWPKVDLNLENDDNKMRDEDKLIKRRHLEPILMKDQNEKYKTIDDQKTSDSNDFGDKENDSTTDEILLLKQALNKIPQIPFALVIDEYRWKFFEGSIDERNINKEFWDLTLELQGIAPPEERSEDYFDVGAKFHVPDNTPYIR